MNKTKVYIQYPWRTSDSQYYKSLIENPPESIEYISENKKIGIIINKKIFNIRTFFKIILRDFLRMSGISLINSRQTKIKEKYDLIHCAHCLSKNNFPWVADFEGVWQMWIMGNKSKRTKEKIKKILLDKNCKKILAWTQTCKKDIAHEFPEIKNKVEVVTYAMPPPKFNKNKKNNNKKITLLHISRYFYAKGGLHTLEAFDILTKKYDNVNAIFISSTPKEVIEKYKENKKIKIFGLIPYKQIIEEIDPNADIFIYPGYSDSFGFAFIEALAFGIPVVTVNGFARKDIIEEGKTGYIIKKPKKFSCEKIEKAERELINQMVKKASIFIENKKLMKKMSEKCMETIKNGKFSLKERNKKLKIIYEGAIRKNGK